MQDVEHRWNRVRAIREERLMTREELAKRSGLSLRTVWSVENGHPCRLVTKREILRGLGVSKSKHTFVFPDAEQAIRPATREGLGQEPT